MNKRNAILGGLAATLLMPARAATIENATVRIETAGSPSAPALRLSVRDAGQWRPVLESIPGPDDGAKLDTLGDTWTSAGGRFRKAVQRPGYTLATEVSPGERPDHVRVVSRVRLSREMPVESLFGAWRFLGGAPDATWTPNLTPEPGQVIGQHAFRSPAVVVQKGGLAALLLPDLDALRANPSALPATLNLDVKVAGGPLLQMALQPHQVQRHVYWRHEPGQTVNVGPGEVVLAYDLLLTAKAEPRRAYRMAARWWWEKQGHKHLTRDTLPQAVPWGTYARTGIDQYVLPVAWREGQMGGETVGGVSMNTWGYRDATMFQCWFNDLRSAYGTYLWGKWMNRPEVVEKARLTRQLLLHSPQKDGLFPVIYEWDRKRWAGSLAGGSEDLYHTASDAWAAYWLLMWHRDLEAHPQSIAFAKRFGDYLIRAQKPSGEIPSYIRPDTMQPTERLVGGAESGASGMFLALLARTTGEQKYMDAARRVAGYLRREIMLENKWFDYETFYSCSGKPEGFYDARTGQHPQNNLSIHWAAEMFRQLYLAGNRPEDLRDGEATLDYLNLYQQVWAPHFLTFEGFGGYGVQNTDAEWNDARQAQFACTNLDYYRLTGKPEYLERGIAATRAGFPTTYMPENAFISPRTFAKEPTGYADENYGHGGVDAPAGPTSWDWGTGSALTAAAYARRYFGDVWVDAAKGTAFGINGVTADWTKGALSVRSSVQTLAPVIVKGSGKGLPKSVRVNGKAVAAGPARWRNGFSVMPAAAPRIRHRPPAVLAGESAAVTFEVWPLSTADVSVTVDGRSVPVQPAATPGVWQAVLPVATPDGSASSRRSLDYSIAAKQGGWTSRTAYSTDIVTFGREDTIWTDRFTGDDLEPRWRIEVPTAGPILEATGSGLTISLPGGRPFDQWIPQNDAPRIMTRAPEGDWSFTARLDTGQSPRGGLYQAGIAVELGDNDFAFWGIYQGASVTLERSGQNGLGTSAFNGPMPRRLDVRARRVGDTLWFDWRPEGGLWSAPVALAAPAPRRAGVILKAWEAIPARVTVTEATMARLAD